METGKMDLFLHNRFEMYMGMDYDLLPNVLGYEIKQGVGRVRNMHFIIYSNDHNPPHFHVKSLDGEIDAKFTIAECQLLSGIISSKDIKRVEAFWEFRKNIMSSVWDKRNQS